LSGRKCFSHPRRRTISKNGLSVGGQTRTGSSAFERNLVTERVPRGKVPCGGEKKNAREGPHALSMGDWEKKTAGGFISSPERRDPGGARGNFKKQRRALWGQTLSGTVTFQRERGLQGEGSTYHGGGTKPEGEKGGKNRGFYQSSVRRKETIRGGTSVYQLQKKKKG